MSFLCWEPQSWTQDSWQGLTRAEQRGRIPSLGLLTTLLLDAAQVVVGLLGCEHTLLGHVELLINQHPKSFSWGSFSTQPVFVLGIALIYVPDLALGLVELHEVCMGPPLKPVKVSLDGIPSLQHVDRTTQLGVVGKLAEGALNPTMSLTKTLNNAGPSTDPWEMPLHLNTSVIVIVKVLRWVEMGSVHWEVGFGVLPVPPVNVSFACCSSCGLPAALVKVTMALHAERHIHTQTCSWIVKPHRVFQSVFWIYS